VCKFEPNTRIQIDLATMKVESKNTVFDFDLGQYNDSFYNWNIAFENSIRKRTQDIREHIFMGLSSGYDSGVIACEMMKQKVPIKYYSVLGSENKRVLNERYQLLNNVEQINITPQLRQDAVNYIKWNTEEFKYTISSSSSDYNEFWLSLTDDNGSGGLSVVCSHAKRDNRRIFISGSGADEIFSDYGFNGVKKYKHSNFGGFFPEKLETIFPWNSFYGSSQESYLAKDEYVAGSYGIEGRFPFLDKYVVQEFLWLRPELKNKNYKSVLYNYLQENNFPFQENEKIGF
jgi:asparagine synthetase B (glutamine-hydrolysing)